MGEPLRSPFLIYTYPHNNEVRSDIDERWTFAVVYLDLDKKGA
jgi:hypothetical protein